MSNVRRVVMDICFHNTASEALIAVNVGNGAVLTPSEENGPRDRRARAQSSQTNARHPAIIGRSSFG